MNFILDTVRDIYGIGAWKTKLELLGFEFERRECGRIYKTDKEVYITFKSVQEIVDFSTEYEGEYDSIIISGNTITIYDGYME